MSKTRSWLASVETIKTLIKVSSTWETLLLVDIASQSQSQIGKITKNIIHKIISYSATCSKPSNKLRGLKASRHCHCHIQPITKYGITPSNVLTVWLSESQYANINDLTDINYKLQPLQAYRITDLRLPKQLLKIINNTSIDFPIY